MVLTFFIKCTRGSNGKINKGNPSLHVDTLSGAPVWFLICKRSSVSPRTFPDALPSMHRFLPGEYFLARVVTQSSHEFRFLTYLYTRGNETMPGNVRTKWTFAETVRYPRGNNVVRIYSDFTHRNNDRRCLCAARTTNLYIGTAV